MKWNPDPRWPREIVLLAEAIAAGDDCRAQLHDALLEEGLPYSAECAAAHNVGMLPSGSWTRSTVVGYILRDGWGNAEYPEVMEMREYLEGRTLCKTH